MRHYETVFIISPELTEEDTQVVVDKFTGILTESGAMMTKVDIWGRRRLAYVVKKFNKGCYVLLDYGATPEAIAELERNFKIDEQVIRYLTVKKADHFDAEAAAAAAEALKAQEAAEQEMEDKKEADEEKPQTAPPTAEEPAEPEKAEPSEPVEPEKAEPSEPVEPEKAEPSEPTEPEKAETADEQAEKKESSKGA